jgi:hypothetical protein
MERLTEYVDGEARQVQDIKIGHRACMAKLAAYEDSGLEPTEVRAIIQKNGELRELLKRLRQEINYLAWDNPEAFCNADCCGGYPDECHKCDDSYNLLKLDFLSGIEEVLKDD